MKDENEQKVCIYLDNLAGKLDLSEAESVEDVNKIVETATDKLLERIKKVNPKVKEVHIFLKSIVGEISIEKSGDTDCLEMLTKKLTQVLNNANQAIAPPQK